MSATTWLRHCTAALHWLERSMTATGGRGSSHSYHLLLGWNKAYPETTGYLIPTLLDYARLIGDAHWEHWAERCHKWLLELQLESGAFPGLLAGSRNPSIFNTAQILFGLTEMARKMPDDAEAQQSLARAAIWLLEQMNNDGSWTRHAFVPGYSPAYYTRALWGLLYAHQYLNHHYLPHVAQKAANHYHRRFFADGSLLDWGFYPGSAAFTHTIAYTLEGALESALLLGDQRLLTAARQIGDRLLEEVWAPKGSMPGRIDAFWKGDYAFRCLTGNAQLAVFYFRCYEIFNQERYRTAAAALLFQETIPYQQMHHFLPQFGGLPGSAPVWGGYLPLRFPNWAAKFLLDALGKAHQHGLTN